MRRHDPRAVMEAGGALGNYNAKRWIGEAEAGFEEFQKTRNVSVQYSVAGGDAARKLASKND